MYAFLVSNLDTGVTGITLYADLDSAVSAYEDHYGTEGDDKVVIRCYPGQPFGINDNGSFGGEEIVSNFY